MSKNRLCARCQDIISNGPDKLDQEEEHHTNDKTFAQAVEQGCYICSWSLRDQRLGGSDGCQKTHVVRHTTYQWKNLLSWDRISDVLEFELWITVYNTADSDTTPTTFWLFEPAIEAQIAASICSELNPSTKSKQTFSLIKEWMDGCVSKHNECQSSANDRVLPTRLIYVESSGTSPNLSARICRGDSLPIKTPYITLSHCWGNTKFLTTTRANLSSFELSIPVNSLSRTFQDALFATVEIGFQYIWIDSLCILQDDAEDWIQESRSMHAIYKNAGCCISASGFSNGLKGFLLPERRIDPVPVNVCLRHQSPGTERSTARNDPKNGYQLMIESPWYEVRLSPIFRRAWTLQEQLLSTRTIYFNDDQVYWQCKCTVASETWPRGWLHTPLEKCYRGSLSDQTWLFNLKDKPYNDTDQAQTSLYACWYDVVANYTTRSLTFFEDQLPALAGITEEFAKYLDDPSIFGLWSNDIHRGILFSESHSFGLLPDHKIVPEWNESPSWSWLARGRIVDWSSNLKEATLHRICNISLTHPLGLKLSGRLSPCPNEYRYSTNLTSPGPLSFFVLGSNDKSFAFAWYPDEWFDSTVEEYLADMTRPSTPEDTEAAQQHREDTFAQSVGVTNELSDATTDTSSTPSRSSSPAQWIQNNRAKAFLGNILIMPILCYVKDSEDEGFSQKGTVMGLLLHPLPGATRGVYRRVGIVEAYIRGDGEMDVHTVQQQFETYRQPLDPHLFQEEDCHGNHVVTVL